MSDHSHHNRTTLCSLSPGDRIEFKRGGYSHWAVYLGDDEVIHVAGEGNDGINGSIRPEYACSFSGVLNNKAKVCKDNFWKVVGDSKAYKNNSSDSKWRALHPDKIINNALAKLGEEGYNIFTANCEHFVNWCRYGEEKSDQVDTALTIGAVAVSAVATVGLVWAVKKFWNKDEEDKEEI